MEPKVIPDPNAKPEKPLLVLRQEFIERLANLVYNESGLHPILILPIMEEATNHLKQQLAEMHNQEATQYKEDLKKWEATNGG